MRFFDFFPTPKFIDPPIAGLCLDCNRISFVRFAPGKHGKIVLKSHGEEDLEPGVVVNGEIKKREDLIKTLSEFRNKYDLRLIRAALPEEKAFLFRTTLPPMNEKDTESALQFKLEENVPMSANDAVFDFIPIASKNKQEKNMTVSVFPKETVYSFLEIFKKSGFMPVSFEPESQTVARSIIRKNSKNSFLIIHIEKEKIGLYIVEEGIVQFTSSFNPKESMAPKVEVDQSGILGTSKGARIYTTDKNKGDLLSEEVDKLLSYWKSLNQANPGRKIEKILTCGSETVSPESRNRLTTIAGAPVEPANVWINAFSLDEYIPNITLEESLKYAPAVGLALPLSKNQSRI